MRGSIRKADRLASRRCFREDLDDRRLRADAVEEGVLGLGLADLGCTLWSARRAVSKRDVQWDLTVDLDLLGRMWSERAAANRTLSDRKKSA